MDFWRAAAILGRRKWLILFSVIVTTALTYGATRLIGSKWIATVRLTTPERLPFAEPSGKTDNPLPEYGPFAKEAAKDQASYLETIAKSRDVIEPVLKKLHDIQPAPDLVDHITVEADSPRLFELRVTDASSTQAQDMVNAIADGLVETNRDLNTEHIKRDIALLEKQTKQANASLGEARLRYDLLRARYRIAGNLANNIDLSLTRLKAARQSRDEVSGKLADAQAQRQEEEKQLAAQPALVPIKEQTDGSPQITQLREALTQADLKVNLLRQRYTDDYSVVKKAIEERATLENQLKAELAKRVAAANDPTIIPRQPNPLRDQLRQEIATLKQQSSGYQAQLASVNLVIGNAEHEVDQFKNIDSPLGVLTGEIAEKSEAHSNLMMRLNSARMALDAAERQNPIMIADKADMFNPPVNSTAGRTIKLIVLSGLCAFLVTSGLAVALDSIDRRLRSAREAEMILPGRVLAAIPQPLGPVSYEALARVTELHPSSLHAEAYRFLGRYLLNPQEADIRSLMVLAAKAEQGSTSTVTNLGITLAQAGRRVVLVDANVRTAEMHQVFGLPNEFGFTNLLKDPSAASWDQALHPTSVANLSVITSGPVPENTWELFRSPNLQRVSDHLHQIADYVLYDTPSALVFTDALNLSSVVDAAFLCVRALEPLTGSERRLVELLEQAHVRVLGNVVNHVPASVVEGYDNYQHYYASALDGMQVGTRSGAEVVVPAQSLIEIPDGNRSNHRNGKDPS